jgi:hypothetical protein
MNKAFTALVLCTLCNVDVAAQSNASSSSEADKRQNNSNESRDAKRNSLPNARFPVNSPASRKPITVNQVEQQTGGKVIGARPVNVQGRQLNQIKVQMPNGRIVIHRQLFDENGRSVDTVQQDGEDPRSRNEAIDD